MLYKTFVKKLETPNLGLQQWLLISCGFSCLLVAARVLVTEQLSHLFLIWNLFLAFVPYAVSQWLGTRPQIWKNKVAMVSILLVWLLFIPNAFYIVTDLFHLDDLNNAPRWFDLLLIFSFAWNGLLLGLLSVRKVETILQQVSGRSFSLLVVFAVMWLNAFGVYIGRYLRFNTWDVLAKPFTLFNELLDIIIHPLRYKMEWGMIGVYAVFMTLIYITIKKMAGQFHQTLK
ncbi:MAG TPA: DUF1361 domain-containing protein [Chitinophagaceae bacterium]|nr:DUF1361 domain-containing protein [Chitinophagaceae bacterium]